MIRVASRDSVPKILLSGRADLARAEANDWIASRSKRRSIKAAQPSFVVNLDLLRHEQVARALAEQFHQKCAFCESAIDIVSIGNVTWFRPPSGAIGSDGTTSQVHYAWLAYDWLNLYLACEQCVRARGHRFPVVGSRARPGAQGSELDMEHPLLLDPRTDDPDAHLVFDDEGLVAGETERGRATIDAFALNRDSLVMGRQEATRVVRSTWLSMSIRRTSSEDITELLTHLNEIMSDQHPYAAACRQSVRRLAQTRAIPAQAAESPPLPRRTLAGPQISETHDYVIIGGVRLKKRSVGREQVIHRDHAELRLRQQAYSVGDESSITHYVAASRFLQRVEISNFKPIEHLDLRVPEDSGEQVPWLMLLGENAAGKSSVLQAIALTLMGANARHQLHLDARNYVRHGATQGEVQIWLTGLDEPLRLTFSVNDTTFGGTTEQKVLLLAYGSTRLLPHSTMAGVWKVEQTRVKNLFDPFTPLADASFWLLSLPNARFTAAARGLSDMLSFTAGGRFVRRLRQREVRCRIFGDSVRLEEMSDGYQSVIALAADIMSVLFSRWDDPKAAEGIVILDELGAHLHPRWRMRIVQSLRQLFPRVQFVVTTHDPLCLRGLHNGEVMVIERATDARHTVVVRTDLPPVTALRVDQLLTSEYFGLRSTVDPDLEAAFNEYYALKAKRSLTSQERGRLEALAAQLEPLHVLGETSRERIALEAAELYLQERRATTTEEDLKRLQKSTLATLRNIWADKNPERF